MSYRTQVLAQSLVAAAFGASIATAHAQAPNAQAPNAQTVNVQAANTAAVIPVLMKTPATARVAARVGPMPVGWAALSSETGEYAAGVDPSPRDGGSGQRGVTLRSLTPDPLGYMALEQSIRADLYRGQRVRLSGFVKGATGADVLDGGLWMRVDATTASECEYSATWEHDRSARDTDWARYEVVLDVPRDAVGISFGAVLNGSGQLWVDDVALEPVGRDVPLTKESIGPAATSTGVNARHDDTRRRRAQLRAYQDAPMRPVNVSFTEGARTS